MNLSLYQLKKKLKLNKQAQGGLVAVVLAGLVGSILVSSATSWYLSMRNNIGNVEDKLEAQTIAQSEWERLSHMSLDELEAKRGELAEKYSAGTGSQYQISVNLGEKGTFNGGTCGAIGSDGYANCFKDTTITVYRDGNRMFTTRTLPLMAGTYTRKEIDDKFASLLRLEPIDEKAEIPEGKALYAYLDGQKLPVSQGGGNGMPDTTRPMDFPYMLSHGYLKSISESVESRDFHGVTLTEKVTTYRIIKSFWEKNDAMVDKSWKPHPIGSTITSSTPISGGHIISYLKIFYPAL